MLPTSAGGCRLGGEFSIVRVTELAAITPRPRVKAPGNAGTVRRRFRRIDPAAARIVMLEAGPHHA
jgi:hypothetical protein